MQKRLEGMQAKMGTEEEKRQTVAEVRDRPAQRLSERDLNRFSTRVTRMLADIDYFVRKPMGWRDGTIVVWAGMRGAVTVAAAQTLPDDTPQRALLVLIAFSVAVLSLLIQGGTVGPLVRRLTPEVDPNAAADEAEERTEIYRMLRASSEGIAEPERPEGVPRVEQFYREKKYRLEVLRTQRLALLDARDNGTFDADMLAEELSNLDAAEITIEMRGKSGE
ncbi:cation:proton antiporter domain-containing protein [Marisediminicola senii]|uniref:cation:proton antiporter domain-containing protein n=1 Tax=Marisediminicola senii TaxID=2711233 RepID=UPI001F2EEFF9|nr:cation:proton antiporter [Marisediminicola senii]